MNEPETTSSSKVPPAERDMSIYEQRGFSVTFGWGPNGLRRLAPRSSAVVIIDTLSFSTSVDLALGRGAEIWPYRWNDNNAAAYAAEVGAELAGADREWNLRPISMAEVPSGLRLVLPSPNGSTLSFGAREAGASTVIVGCLRNATAVARSLDEAATVAVIAAGERWRGGTGPLRPALEDLLGAGAIISALGRSSISPEAMTTAAAFEGVRDQLDWVMRESASGREHRSRFDPKNIELAAALDSSRVVPTLIDDRLVDAAPGVDR